MKNFTLKILCLFFLLFTSSIVSAVELANDTFTNSDDGWTGNGISEQNNELRINRNSIAAKTFNFGSSYANAQITITFDYKTYGGWENSGFNKDYMKVYFNNTLTDSISKTDGTYSYSKQTTLDADGTITITIKADTTYSNEELKIDNFIITTAGDTPLNSADDLCYDDVQTNGFCFGIFNIMCTITTPIKNLSSDTLSDVHVALGTSSLFSAFNDCGVNGTSGNCEDASGKSFMMFSAFSNGINYDLPDYSGNETQTTYNSAMFSFLSGGYDWVGSYVKNGVTHQGALQACTATVESSGDRDFELRHQENIRGDVKSIGNTVLCKLNNSGQCIEPNNYNDETDLQKAPTSSATLTLPEGATVKYARIYWQGREAATSTQTAWSTILKERAKKIYLKKDTGNYSQLTADIADFSSTESINWINIYSASADASNVVTGAGTYYVDTTNFETNTGKTWTSSPKDALGNYGAWMLVVAYHDPNTNTTKNITIFDGYKKVTSSAGSVDVSVSGFLTPKINDVDSTLYIFTAEGDKYISGDHLKMAGERYNTTLTDIAPTTNNAFDSRIDITAIRNPSLINNNGIDIQQYNVGTTGKNIIANNETGAKFQFTSTQDTYFPSVIVFSTQIYAPRLCYDYTYGQDGVFQTAPSIQPPLLDGTFDKSRPIDVKLYFKNLENSDISITNLTVDIDPIDISLAKYRLNSVSITPPNQSIQHIDNDTGLDVGPSRNYVKDIPIGDVGALDYFYTYYSLDTNQTTINAMPINVTLNYDLHVIINNEDTPLGNMHTQIQDMDPCQGDSYYEPVPGIFNIVHSGQAKTADPYYYFNLPTQVVGRVGNFKVESMDPDDLNRSKTGVKDTNVTVEMINVAGFHYATASCTDQNATVVSNNSVLVFFDNNTTTYTVDLDKTAMRNAGFFNTAVKNAAFRLGYYKDANTSGERAQACSRDNFTIRPESYSFKFVDYNHSNPSQSNALADNNGSTIKTVNLAAGYNYKVKIEATDHLNNAPTPGYTTSNVDANMTWQEPTPLDCNDESNITLSPAFLSGASDTNNTWNNVGKYKLHIIDTQWTAVDSNPNDMQHHVTPYFQVGTNTDCIANSNVVQNENSSSLNGCDISSVHNNTEHSQYFQDMNIIYVPYKFDLNGTNGASPITPTIGLLFTAIPNTTPYIYIADINETLDENMSYHLNGSINALGENNITLTNFVDKCYAVALDINISTSNRDLNNSNGNHVDYRVRFHDLNASNAVIPALDINVTDDATTSHTADILLQTVQTSTKGYFPKNLNGTMQTRLNMNYVREKDTTVNPTTLTFVKYQVNCTNALNDCTFNADLINNKTTQGTKDLNSTIPIRHYYGRTHAPRQTITGSDGNVSIYYEVFCNGATCNKALLQDGIDSNTTDDPRWFVNTRHSNEAGTAAQTATIQKNASNVTITREADGNHPDYIGVHYNGNSGYPYKATMENNASDWLIYNKYNPNAVTNEFEVEFVKAGGAWAGMHETNATTNKNATENTNRRLMW